MKVGEFLDRMSELSTIERVVFYENKHYKGGFTKQKFRDRMYGVWANYTIKSFEIIRKELIVHIEPVS